MRLSRLGLLSVALTPGMSVAAGRGIDADGDGFPQAVDCNDGDASIHPLAHEMCGDAIDSDCTGRPSNGCAVDELSAVGVYFESAESQASLGQSVANMGDMDGDGRDDFVVGSPVLGYVGRSLPDFAGAAYVVYGTDAATSGGIDGAYGARVVGDSEYEEVGIGVAGVGDLDGDGTPDVAISSYGDDSVTCASCGDVRVFFGPVYGELALEDGDVDVRSLEHGDLLGRAVSRGDFDGDAADDLIVSSLDLRVSPTAGYRWDGAVYFFSSPVDAALDASGADATFQGGPNSFAGGTPGSLPPLADEDGDGIADLAIGAPTQGYIGGVVMLVHGPLEGTMSPTDADVTYTTSHADPGGLHFHGGDGLGDQVAWGDLDGDGHPDLAMGASLSNDRWKDAGAAYVVYGPHTTSMNVRDADATIWGSVQGAHLGTAVTGGADFDADGHDDLVVTELYGEVTSGTGDALVFYGPIEGQRAPWSADVALGGAGGGVGDDVDVLDFDGDGAPDLLVGGRQDDYDGRVYVVPNSAL